MAKSPSRTMLNDPWGKVRVSSGDSMFFRCSVAMIASPFTYAEPLLSDAPLQLDVFPAHLPINVLGHTAEPGVLLGHRGHLLVGCLVLHERHEDQFFRLPVAIADQLHDLPGDLWPDRLLPLLVQGVELRLPSGLETRVTNGPKHGVLLCLSTFANSGADESRPGLSTHTRGAMLRFIRNRFSGSYFVLRATRRS